MERNIVSKGVNLQDIEVWDVSIEELELYDAQCKIECWIGMDTHTKRDKMYVGFDPGTANLGIAVIDDNIKLFQIKIENKPKDPIKRMKLANKLLSHCVNSYKYNTVLVIEGAAFSKRYREAELSEVRATAVWWGIKNGFDVQMYVPNKIRKAVFGSGKKRPQEEWASLPPDAANALACAWYPLLSSK